jgi:parallel beta-helix repeat protein/predicted outer membrane repeat protein
MKTKSSTIVVILGVLFFAADSGLGCGGCGNSPPEAVLSLYCDCGPTITFDGSDSTDDGGITKYEWDFDYNGTFNCDYEETEADYPDGTFDGVTTHIYTSPGTYTVMLRVTDNGWCGTYLTDTADCMVIIGGTTSYGGRLGEGDKVPGRVDILEEDAYKEGELIVKFKRPVSDTLEQQLAGKAKLSNPILSASLDGLNRKHKVRVIEPVFKDFKAGRERMSNLLNKDAKLLSSDEKRLLRRQQRAPKGAKAPELDRIYKITLEPGQSAEQAVADYSRDPAIEYAELNYIVSISLTPNDPNYPVQWALNNTGQMYPASGNYRNPPGRAGCDVNAPQAWDIHTGSSEVVVAVIDTGVDYNHRDLQGNMWVNSNGYFGYDFVNKDNDPMDDMGHGTHCAGIIAARANNSLDIAGVSWNAKIMAVKFLNAGGGGTVDDGAKAIEYATDNGADILSNSWGWTGPDSNTVRQAIEDAISQGVIVVAAAGNNNSSTPLYPAIYDHVISVAATDSNDDKASFSNYGSLVDIAAPGVDVLSLRAFLTGMGTLYGKKLTVASGTSMACPHVAGACALLLSVNSPLSSDDANTILRNAADTLSNPNICASGRLNVERAIRGAVSSKGYVNLDRHYYSCDTNVGILVSDLNLAGNGTCDVNVTTSGGDSEVVMLSEVGSGVGIFTGSIATGSGDPCVGDGDLQVANGQTITGTYCDANDGTGNSAEPNDLATVDGIIPVISNVHFAKKADPEQVVTFQTSEFTTARVICGTSCVEPNIVVECLNPRLSHTIKFKGLEPLTNYCFKIEATDQAGNTAVDSNSGNCYWFVTGEGPRDINVPGDYNTIQQAIDAAWDGSTVWISDGTYTGAGNRDIDFKGRIITVRSVNGPNNCIINCQGNAYQQHQAFLFRNEEAAVLQGLTIKNSYVNCPGGGAVMIIYSSPRIADCVFRDNWGGNGGAVYNAYGYPDINNCTFTENDGRYGAAIFDNLGHPVITRCLFSKNTAIDYGGAIYGYSTHLLLDDCTFSENTAGTYGGVADLVYGDTTATDCNFSSNSSGGWGGGFCHSALSNQFINCIFSGNIADSNGGAICNWGGSSSTVINCTFSGNSSTGSSGGGIFNGNYSTPTVINCRFFDNTAKDRGGAVSNAQLGNYDFDLTNSLFYGNSAYYGGAIANYQSRTHLVNCTVGNNSAENGGGICNYYSGAAILTNCILWGNDANASGNEVYNGNYAYSSFSYCDIKECGGSGAGWDTGLGNDGGHNIDQNPLFTGTDLHIPSGSPCVNTGDPNGNYTGQTDIDGQPRVIETNVDIGADEMGRVQNITKNSWYMHIQDAIDDAVNSNVIVTYPDIYYETADFKGKGITVRSTDPNDWDVVTNTVIEGNTDAVVFKTGENANSVLTGFTVTTTSVYGEGFDCLNSSPKISRCIISDNYMGVSGLNSTPTITNNIIRDNSVDGISCGGDGSAPVIKNNLIYNNDYYGIRLNSAKSKPIIYNNTIAANNYGIGYYGPGLLSPTISNCIFWNNNTDDLIGCSATYSCIEDGDSGTGNISSDPCFVDAGNGNYHLDANSLCIDTGNSSGSYTGQTDIDGDDRVINVSGKGDGIVDVDMGADEYDPNE